MIAGAGKGDELLAVTQKKITHLKYACEQLCANSQ